MERKRRKRNRVVCGVFFVVLLLYMTGCGNPEESSNGKITPTSRPSITAGTEITESPKKDAGNDTDGEPKLSAMPEQEAADVALSELLEGMTLEEKVGQMFLVRCPEDALKVISRYHVGGYVLFARDFEGETKESLRKTVEAYQEASEIPMLISVDEEGGLVVRVSKYREFRDSAFLSPRELYADGGMEEIAEDTKEKAELLLSLGINVNLAPVCDIADDKAAFLYDRSFGGTAKETADYVKTVVETAKDAGLGSVLKHFPGYGNNADTHEGIVRDSRSYEIYAENDFQPFLAGIKAGAGAVMVSHNIVQCMDGERPASLSPEVHRILREELAFDGVILTDDLYMDAIQEFAGTEAAAVAAVLAGNDMLCCTDFEVQIPAVIAAVKDGRISEEQIDASVLRILQWKEELGLLP